MTVLEALPMEDISRFCQKWQILDLSLFGSVLREDFEPESDLDVLVTFDGKSEWSLFDHVQMQQELEALLSRKVDLISRRALDQTQNALLRDEILRTAKVIFSQAQDTYVKR